MQSHLYVALVTLLALAVYFWMATQVARTRGKLGIQPPVMTGDPRLERTIRAHLNMLEWLPIFLPSLWLFAIYWNSSVAAGLGLVWIAGRIAYFLGYVPRRESAFRASSSRPVRPRSCCSAPWAGSPTSPGSRAATRSPTGTAPGAGVHAAA